MNASPVKGRFITSNNTSLSQEQLKSNDSSDRILAIYNKLLRVPLEEVKKELFKSDYLTYRVPADTIVDDVIFSKGDSLLHMLVTAKNILSILKKKSGDANLIKNNIYALRTMLESKNRNHPTPNPYLGLLLAENCSGLTFFELDHIMNKSEKSEEPIQLIEEFAECKKLGADLVRSNTLHDLANQVKANLDQDKLVNTCLSKLFTIIQHAKRYYYKGGKEYLEAKDGHGKKFNEYLVDTIHVCQIKAWMDLPEREEDRTHMHTFILCDSSISVVEEKVAASLQFFLDFPKLHPKEMEKHLFQQNTLEFLKGYRVQIYKETELIRNKDNILHLSARYFAKGVISVEQLYFLMSTLGRYIPLAYELNNAGLTFYDLPELQKEQKDQMLVLLQNNVAEIFQFPYKTNLKMLEAFKNPCLLDFLSHLILSTDYNDFCQGDTIFHIAVRLYLAKQIPFDNIKNLISILGNNKNLITVKNKLDEIFYLIPGLKEEESLQLYFLINQGSDQSTNQQTNGPSIPKPTPPTPMKISRRKKNRHLT